MRPIRAFVVTNIARTHREYLATLAAIDAVEREAARLGRAPVAAATRRAVIDAYARFERELRQLAERSALDATAKIQFQLKRTAKRPETGIGGPHIKDLIVCRAAPRLAGFETGVVEVADIEQLDKAIDPDYPEAGPYWRAQEYGTTAHVGREIRGYFFGPGWSNPLRPQSPPPNPLQPLFSPRASGPRGGSGGKGTIQQPIAARHFIEHGADAARANWKAGLHAIERQAVRELVSIGRASRRVTPAQRAARIGRRPRRV